MYAKCTSVNGTVLFYATSGIYWNIERTLWSVHMLCANKRTLLFGSSLLAGSDTSLTTDS